MVKSVALVALVALAAFQVALAQPARKLRADDVNALIAQASAKAIAANDDAQSALQAVLEAARIGDLDASRAAFDKADEASLVAQEQADLAKDLAVKAVGGKVRAVADDVAGGLREAIDDAGWSIKDSLTDGNDELQRFVKRIKLNNGRLPRKEIDAEISKLSNLGEAALDDYADILDSANVTSKINDATQLLTLWQSEVNQAAEAAEAAQIAADDANNANAEATTAAPTTTAAPATDAPATDAPTTEAPATEAAPSRKRRSIGDEEDDTIENGKDVLASLLTEYSGVVDFAKQVTGSIVKDAFDTAAKAVDRISKYRNYNTVADAASKLTDAIYEIDDAVDAKLSRADGSVDDVLDNLDVE